MTSRRLFAALAAALLATALLAPGASARTVKLKAGGVRLAVIGEGNPGDGFANLNSQGIYNYGTDIKTGVTGYVYFSYLTCGLVSPTDDATR